MENGNNASEKEAKGNNPSARDIKRDRIYRMKEKIKLYIHCKNCLDVKKMEDQSKIAVGLNEDQSQVIVVCENCDKLVAYFELK